MNSLYVLSAVLLLVIHSAFAETKFKDVYTNAQTMINGIDLATFDITRLNPIGKQKKAIMHLSRTSNSELPEQMEPIEGEDRYNDEKREILIRQSSELTHFVKNTNTLTVSISAEYANASAYITDSFSTQMTDLTVNSRFMAMSHTCLSTYKLTFNDSAITLNPELLQLINQGVSTYQTIVQQYGTHYIASAIFGGCELSTAEIDSTLFTRVSEVDYSIAVGVAAELTKVANVSAKVKLLDEKLKSKVQSMISSTIRHCTAVGGVHTPDDCYDDDGKHQRWVASVNQAPRLIWASLSPIYEFPAFEKTKAQMKTVVDQVVARTVLIKLKRHILHGRLHLNSLSGFNSHLAKAETDALIGRINACIGAGGSMDLAGCAKVAQQAVNLIRVAELASVFDDLTCRKRRKLRCAFNKTITELGQTFSGNVDFLLYLKQHYISKSCSGVGQLKPSVAEAIERWPDVKGRFKQFWQRLSHFMATYPDVDTFEADTKEVDDILGNVQSVEHVAYECSRDKWCSGCNACPSANVEALCGKYLDDCKLKY